MGSDGIQRNVKNLSWTIRKEDGVEIISLNYCSRLPFSLKKKIRYYFDENFFVAHFKSFNLKKNKIKS